VALPGHHRVQIPPVLAAQPAQHGQSGADVARVTRRQQHRHRRVGRQVGAVLVGLPGPAAELAALGRHPSAGLLQHVLALLLDELGGLQRPHRGGRGLEGLAGQGGRRAERLLGVGHVLRLPYDLGLQPGDGDLLPGQLRRRGFLFDPPKYPPELTVPADIWAV
jgi:hypothetical protein